MQKNNRSQFAVYSSLILGFILSVLLLFIAYYVFKILGVEERMNSINRDELILWRKQEFNPKRYFKMFYNASIFLIPAGTLLFSVFLKRFTTNRKVLDDISHRILQIKGFIVDHHILIMITMLLVVLVDFGYLIQTGIWINYYHHNFIIAAVNDLLAGKHLLVDTFSQYGTLFPGMLYLIFRLGVTFSYMNLYLLFMIFTVIYYFILYFFLYSLTKNKLYSLIGLFFIMGINTLLNYPTFPDSENYVWPGGTVLRYFFDISVFSLLFQNKNFSSKPLFFLASALTAFAILYNIETGIALSAGLIAYIFFFTLSKKAFSLRKKTLIFIAYSMPLIFFGILFSSLFALYTYNAAGVWPNWSLFIKFVRLANGGISNINTPLFGWHIGYLLLYFFGGISVLYRILIQKETVSWKHFTIAALSVYGLFLMNYYMSRSVFSNLTVVSIPMGILIVVFLQELSRAKKIYLRTIYMLLLIIVTVVSLMSTVYLIKRIQCRWYAFNYVREAKKYQGNRAFIVVGYNEEPGITADGLFTAVTHVKKLTKGSKRILLFSRFDTVILIMSERTHLLPLPLLEQIYYKRELEEYKKMLVIMKEKPEYLFVDVHNTYNPPSASYGGARELFETIKPFYTFYKRAGILDIYRLKQ